ncbi:hypothetical protein CC80DRAFT_186395 [Byssothecium circinans]|uniref:Uncharacterized protein n=1 Tax=Byssothecium circinans TaxID=147558 RepID=A0A6A5TI35_9PLEO|nr:hypothetical protein CC80DRAFT_186395 [Byssothecium circinans]
MAKTSYITVRYDFVVKELMLRFETRNHALAYQAKNRQARFLNNKGENDVWIPVEPSMQYVRPSGVGSLIHFEDSDAAAAWCQSSVVGTVRPKSNQDVDIKSDWKDGALEKVLGMNEATLPHRWAVSIPKPSKPSPKASPEVTGYSTNVADFPFDPHACSGTPQSRK